MLFTLVQNEKLEVEEYQFNILVTTQATNITETRTKIAPHLSLQTRP